jgi:hypothetical protein
VVGLASLVVVSGACAHGTQFDPDDPGRSRRWYTDIPEVLREHPQIKGLVRWDSDFDCGLQIDSGPGMLAAFREAGLDPWVNQAVAQGSSPTG